MASFYRWEERGRTQQIPLLCVSRIPGDRWAVTRCPRSPPNSQACITGQARPGAETSGEAERIPAGGRDAAGEVAPPHGPGSLPKFVNSRGGGRAPRRTSERRGEEGRGPEGGAIDSPEKAKSPEAQRSAPQSAASRRGPGMPWGRGRGTGRFGRAHRGALTPAPGRGINRAAPPRPRPACSAQALGRRTRGGAPRPAREGGAPGVPRPCLLPGAAPGIPRGLGPPGPSPEPTGQGKAQRELFGVPFFKT